MIDLDNVQILILLTLFIFASLITFLVIVACSKRFRYLFTKREFQRTLSRTSRKKKKQLERVQARDIDLQLSSAGNHLDNLKNAAIEAHALNFEYFEKFTKLVFEAADKDYKYLSGARDLAEERKRELEKEIEEFSLELLNRFTSQ